MPQADIGVSSTALSWYPAKVVTRVVVWFCVLLSESLVDTPQLACLRSGSEGSIASCLWEWSINEN